MIKKLLSEMVTNDDGRYSTTNGIQILAIVSLCIGFFYSFAVGSPSTTEIAYCLTFIAVATPASKGWVTRKSKDAPKAQAASEPPEAQNEAD